VTLAERVDELAAARPDDVAFREGERTTTWRAYRERAQRLARLWLGLGLDRGDRVAALLPDGVGPHVAFAAAERAGLVAVGIGARAGPREIKHLLEKTGARALLTPPTHRSRSMRDFAVVLRHRGLALDHHVVAAEPALLGERAGDLSIEGEPVREAELAPPAALAGRALPADEPSLLNSTSGTTGMPRIVVHDQARWLAFHEFAVRTGALTGDDVFASVVPAPFGFGLWTRHFTPALLGVPVVVEPEFDAARTLERIEQHRVTVLAAVTTQLVMLLEAGLEGRDLSSLRVVYTGGEAVPYERAAAFEDATGAAVLQFYGSNETGLLCGTALTDPRERRLRTAGRVFPEMNVRLFDEHGKDVTATGRGRPGCKGPTLSRGYWQDDAANRALIREDGWMLLGDVVEIDAEGWLRVVGRTDDFIIRGGKNISGPAVEAQCGTHPAIAHCAAVAMPDPVFGEKVCLYAELREGASLGLDELAAHLRAREASIEYMPERLEIVTELPRGSGGKIAKQQLREDVRRRMGE